ncbi:MAG: molybdopterin-dependent oxidoreductase [Clostridiales Family XIII bacterium]|jgi:trimethylamine-N-oxide reductase (cytochrome c)|nr:molybdopterin-dependent oxidoreductase [Clostridiales Family XIII bacterium]
MSETISYGNSLGGPLQIHVEDGRIRRVRPLVLKDDDPDAWTIEARGRKFTPPRKVTVTALGLMDKDKAYAYDRVLWPLIREDFTESPDGRNRNTENRGKSGYRRASWDEALGLVSREIKRVQSEYGKEAVTACTSSHHSWGLLGYKLSAFKRFFNLLGYTQVLDNPDSWEGFHWGASHTYGHFWRLGCPEPFDLLEDCLQNCETLIFWSHDPDSTHGCYSANESNIWRRWFEELGISVIYIDPFNNFTSVKQGEKWIGPRPGTDSALMEAIAYVWLTEDTYDHAYVARHVHRFEEWADHICGRGADRTPKTPKWAEEISGVRAPVITALARRWASTNTMGGSGVRIGWGGACRTDRGCDYARLLVHLFVMQGLGKPGRGMWTANAGAPIDYDFWFGGYSDPKSSIANEPIADRAAVNCVEQKLYRPTLPDAILNGGDEWLGDGFCGLTLEQQFKKHVYPLEGCSRVHLFYRYGGTFFGSMTETNKWVKMYQSPELQFVVNQDIHLSPEGKFADVILPACTNLERTDIGEFCNSGNGGYASYGQSGNNWQVVVYQKKAIEPLGESHSDYWIFSELAKCLGFGEAYTEGRDEEAWCKRFWQFSDLSKRISWEDFQKRGYYIPGVPKNWKRRPAFRWFVEGKACEYPSRDCQKEGLLGTKTGKIEFVSEMLEAFDPDDDVRAPMPAYKPSREGHCSALHANYPLHLIAPHPRFGFHTHYDQHNKWLWEIPEHRQVVQGNPYAVIRMHPEQAAARGIESGDIVRVFNDRGAVFCAARVSNRLEKHTVHCYGSSGMYEPVAPGECSEDKAGCVNILTSGKLMGKNVPGMAPNSTLVEIEKYDGALIPGMRLYALLERARGEV